MKNIIKIAILLSLSGCFQYPPPKTGLEGKRLPSFSILLADSNNNLNTDSIGFGKPFVIIYFKPDCAHCRAQINDIIKHEKELNDTKFYLLTNYPYKEFKKFFFEFHLNEHRNIVTGIDNNSFFSNYLYITTVPYFAFYDKEKRLKQITVGKVKYKELKNYCDN
jgi:thiol-disulfide isomerase/thioredoxin